MAGISIHGPILAPGYEDVDLPCHLYPWLRSDFLGK